MPEGPEIETDKLREAIDEEIERKGGGHMLRWISLSTAVIAAIAAVAALRAGDTVNEALALKTDAAQLQGQASDQWAYYQAKGIKGAVAHAMSASYKAAGKNPPPETETAAARYEKEQGEIQTKARELEKERDAKGAEAGALLERHHLFANSVALFQVAIALGAVAALTRMRPVWYASIVLGMAGLGFFVWPMLAG
jgi:hypothetical protein